MTRMRDVPAWSAPGGSRNEMQGDRALSAIAARQHGVVGLADLSAAGIARGALAHRVAEGRLSRLHRGIYLVGPVRTPHTREIAAVLAAGDGAVLSHRSAAALLGIGAPPAGLVEVTVAGRKARHRPGIRIHRTRGSMPATSGGARPCRSRRRRAR
jgi:predicted transcriptional regulator of viral defense system